MFLQGQGDERYQQHVTMTHELLQKGVPVNERVWLYEIRNLTHVPRDNPYETTTPSDGDRLGYFVSASIRNLRAYLEERRPPPVSRMTGRIVGDALRFEQAGGATTNAVPFGDDPSLDTVVVGPNLTLRTIGGAETARWLAVRGALGDVEKVIRPPTVACRLGGYELMFFGSQLVPCAPADLLKIYGGFDRYRAALIRTVASLEAQNLYDQRVESASDTAERARSLFGSASPSPPHSQQAQRPTTCR
jgi:hypothetical protein